MPAQPARGASRGLRTTENQQRASLRLDPFQAIKSEAIRLASARVLKRWANGSDEMLSGQDVIYELLELSRLVEGDQSSLAATDDSATVVLRCRLLQELRSETLAEWSASRPPAAADMLAVLNGFERAQSMLEPVADDGFTRRLSEPGGLGLVVEVAHDLRSPLTSILFLTETMLRGGSGTLSDLQRRQIGIVYSAALGLINVASDVVEMARGSEPLDPSETVPFSLNAIMEPVRDIVLPMAEEKGVDVILSPATPDERIGLPIPLSRVLLNLTTNALKFTSEGHIEISARCLDSRRIEFSVRDTGCGIDAEALRTLFHPFRRRSGPRSGYYFSGTGLGLTICRKLVRAMGGELQVETSRGLGTRFFFDVVLPPRHTSEIF
jgi:signal transduction histidine kinase